MSAELSNVRKVNFDVCTICNHACVFCPNKDKRAAKYMCSAEDFERVMTDVAASVDLDELGISAKGEPLLNPELPEIVRIAKEQFKVPYVYISTNGSLMDPETLETLLDAGLDSIKFSVNAFDRKSYAEIHGKDHFERVMANLANAADMTKKRPFNLLTSSVCDLEPDEIKERLRERIGDRVEAIKYILRYANEFRPQDEDRRPTGLKYKPCAYLFNEVFIDANCDLVACCIDYFGDLHFGNLKEHSLEELWNSDRFQALRRRHTEGKLPPTHLCYRCLTHDQDMLEGNKRVKELLKDKRT